jgi:hypothetical protein
MEDLAGLGTALAAARPCDDSRYEGCLMLSALPSAPTIELRPGLGERLRRLIGGIRGLRSRVEHAAPVRADARAGRRGWPRPLLTEHAPRVGFLRWSGPRSQGK